MPSEQADRRSAARFAATFRIRLGYPDLDAFLDGYAVNISKGGIYVPTKQPRERGTEVRFELLLKDGSTAVSGVGRVAWSKPFDPARPGERYGMGVQFVSLEGASDGIIQRAVAWREHHLGAEEASREIAAESAPPAPPKTEPAAAEPATGAAPAVAAAEPAAPQADSATAAVAPEPEAVAPAATSAASEPVAAPPTSASVPEPVPTPEPHAASAAATPRGAAARRVLGGRKVSLGNVDAVLASLRTKRDTAEAPPAVKPVVARAAEPETPPESGAPMPEPEAETKRPQPALEPEAGRPEGEAPEPEAAPIATAAHPEPEAPAAAAPAAEDAAPPADDDLPSLDDLEAALASVSKPPPRPSGSASGDIMITEGAPAVAHVDQPEDVPAPAAPHDVDGLELPSWDDDEQSGPLLSQQPGPRQTIDLDVPLPLEDAPSDVLEAADDDLDVDSLPLSARARVTPAGEQAAAADLFTGLPDRARRPSSVPPDAPAQPELPVVGGVVPAMVGAALRSAREAAASGTEDAGTEEEGPTHEMTEDIAAAMSASLPPAASQASLADLPPPPDMPAPIPPTPADDKKKQGLLGRMFGRKKK